MRRRLFVILLTITAIYLATFVLVRLFPQFRRSIVSSLPPAAREPLRALRNEPYLLYGFLRYRFAPGVSERQAAGAALFQSSCSACHGMGEADATVLARQSFSKLGDFEMGQFIFTGPAVGDMPVFVGRLSSAEVFDVVTYLKSLEGSPADAVRTSPPPVLDGAYKYVALDGAIRVYDLGKGYAPVKQVRVENQANVRGIAASPRTGLLYSSFDSRRGDKLGNLVCIDLASDEIRWVREYSPGIDSIALSPDGARIYMPTGEGLAEHDKGEWVILDALTGDERNRVVFGTGPHNTIVSPDGKFVYLAPVATSYLGVLDARTEKIVRKIGPFGSNIRPFTLTSNGKYALVNVDFLSGFEVADLESGKVIHRVQVEGFPWEDPVGGGATQSHGVALSPDETEAWVSDAWNRHVHVFDVSDLPNRPRQIHSVNLVRADGSGGLPKWINFSRDGRYVHISNGAIIDAKSREIVKWIAESRHFLEVHFEQGRPVAAFPRYGLGYGGPAWWTNDNELTSEGSTSVSKGQQPN